MKKLHLIFSMLILRNGMQKSCFFILCFLALGTLELHAQCDGLQICLASGDTPDEAFTTPLPDVASEYCDINSDCSGLVTEYLIVSDPDTTILGSVAIQSFDPDDYPGECFTIVPVCYDLIIVQELVDAMNTSSTCCNAVNTATPDGVSPPICDGIKSLYSSGSQVTSMDDVLAIFSAFGSGALTFNGFLEAVATVNDNGTALGIACFGLFGGSAAVSYCVNPTIDFSVNAYEIVPYDVDRFALTEPLDTTIKAVNVITSTATVDLGAAVIYRAGNSIDLEPDFEVKGTGEFLGEIVPCPDLVPLDETSEQYERVPK